MNEDEWRRFLVRGRISSQDYFSHYYLHYVLLKYDLCASDIIDLYVMQPVHKIEEEIDQWLQN